MFASDKMLMFQKKKINLFAEQPFKSASAIVNLLSCPRTAELRLPMHMTLDHHNSVLHFHFTIN